MISPKTSTRHESEIYVRGGQPTGNTPRNPAYPEPGFDPSNPTEQSQPSPSLRPSGEAADAAGASLRVPFTVLGLGAVHPPASGEINIRDEGTPGLFYRLRSTGGGSFIVRYRVKGQGTPKRMTLGTADLGQKAEDRTDFSPSPRPARGPRSPRARPAQVKTRRRQ